MLIFRYSSHLKISRSIDTSAALAYPDVVAVFTGKDLSRAPGGVVDAGNHGDAAALQVSGWLVAWPVGRFIERFCRFGNEGTYSDSED